MSVSATAGRTYDVAIVGASIAGCAAAVSFARKGARVALIESHSDPAAYKRTCTHFIQPSATPTIERLGLSAPIEDAGGIRNGVEFWSRYGWMRPELGSTYQHPAHGYSIRRQKLDPILRSLAADSEGVELMLGTTATGLRREGGRITGVVARGSSEETLEIEARLVVGADGRASRVARWAGLRGRVKRNARFVYFAYHADLPLASGTNTQFWLLDPDVGYAFPNDDGLTLLACLVGRDRLAGFRRDPEGVFTRFFADLPRAPALERGIRVSPLMAKLEMPNVLRPAMGPGVALVGDAGLAADPLWGVGIGWALQSAEWLAESTAGAALGEDELGRALQRYRRRRNQSFLGHYLQIAGYSGARRFNPFERLMLAAGTIDPESARRFHAFTARSSFGSVLAPPALGRAVSVVIANRASLLTAGCQGRRPFRPARLIGPCVIRPPAPLRPDELAAAEAIPPRYQVD